MTCVVGLVGKDGTMFLGADGLISDNGVKDDAMPGQYKVWDTGTGMLVGYSGNAASGQILRYGIDYPDMEALTGDGEPTIDDDEVVKIIIQDIIQPFKSLLKENGRMERQDDETENQGGTILIATRSRLFEVDGAYFVMERRGEKGAAIGSGRECALGALSAIMAHNRSLSPAIGVPRIDTRTTMDMAIIAACEINPFCGGTITIFELPPYGREESDG